LTNASVHDFAIIEYRDTIGGRAWHKPFGKGPDGKPYTIEMGANWVCTLSEIMEMIIN
jgi:polyamine oxidase